MNFEQKINLREFSSSLKDGDCLAFYHTQWYFIASKIIAFVSGFKMDHIAVVANVNRTKYGFVTFDLYECTVSKGVHCTHYYITRNGDTDLPISDKRLMYYIKCKRLTSIEREDSILDLCSQLGNRYNWRKVFWVPFNNILTKSYREYKRRRSPGQFCSGYVLKNKRNIKAIPEEEYRTDELRTPYQVACLSCFKEGFIIK